MLRYTFALVSVLLSCFVGISVSSTLRVSADANTCIDCENAQVASRHANQVTFMPSVSLSAIPRPPTLLLPVNDNYDNSYTIEWQHDPLEVLTDIFGQEYSIVDYTVEEASIPDFSQATIVYQGREKSANITGRLPGTYFYRVKANEFDTDSQWSNTQPATIYSLFVGLSIRWDSVGYIRGSQVKDVGHHEVVQFTGLTEGDTVATQWHSWYDPNPFGSKSSTYTSYYSATSGAFRSSTEPSDPSWKWGAPFFMPYSWTPQQGQPLTIYGQVFSVKGPLVGFTTYGRSISYWEMVNERKFLTWDGGGDIEQYVHAGDIVLRYHAGASRLRLYDSVLRHNYEDGDQTGDTVQYIGQLTASNALEGSGPVEPTSDVVVESESRLPGSSRFDGADRFGIMP